MNPATPGNSVGRDQVAQDNGVHLGQLLREAIEETATPYKVVAIALDVKPAYLTRMLDGEKPWPLHRMRALPDQVEAAFVRRYATALGLEIVTRDERAQVLGELLEALGRTIAAFHPELPTRAGRPLKAALASAAPIRKVAR